VNVRFVPLENAVLLTLVPVGTLTTLEPLHVDAVDVSFVLLEINRSPCTCRHTGHT